MDYSTEQYDQEKKSWENGWKGDVIGVLLLGAFMAVCISAKWWNSIRWSDIAKLWN